MFAPNSAELLLTERHIIYPVGFRHAGTSIRANGRGVPPLYAERAGSDLGTCASLAREFVRIIRQRDAVAWMKWKEDAKTSLLASFAKHLCQVEAALVAALQLPWSNGPVEGHVHRLKPIKRSMYGRAKFDLLRLRVVNAE